MDKTPCGGLEETRMDSWDWATLRVNPNLLKYPSFLTRRLLPLHAEVVIRWLPLVSMTLVDSDLDSEDELYSFGDNNFGQLGFGNPQQEKENVLFPTSIHMLSDKKVKKVVACGHFSLVLSDEGEVFTFGDNSAGQLGLLGALKFHQPQLIVGLQNITIVDVSIGLNFCAAVTDKGHLYMWGSNEYGQLGLGHTKNQPIPIEVSFFSRNKTVSKVCCGYQHTIVITVKNIFGFGRNSCGELGLGNTHIQPTPQPLSLFEDTSLESVDVACGHNFTIISNSNPTKKTNMDRGRAGVGEERVLERETKEKPQEKDKVALKKDPEKERVGQKDGVGEKERVPKDKNQDHLDNTVLEIGSVVEMDTKNSLFGDEFIQGTNETHFEKDKDKISSSVVVLEDSFAEPLPTNERSTGKKKKKKKKKSTLR
eukprot:TRINITY_DN29901_c0_g1_i1.p1 TRINITY_DN29901_c0_g1~~TRINITY_DN29901_c0_g1_i1.p1  ORF type:complete len:423 (-),score=111.49 TRINITY_DN29901_c0_g1_i1:209-1477(-)